jgi:hypothetical protein
MVVARLVATMGGGLTTEIKIAIGGSENGNETWETISDDQQILLN